MNVFDLPAEVAQSCLEMAVALSLTAQGRDRLLRTASFVHRCYVRAVSPAPSQRAHDLRWRRFVTALDAFLERCPATPQAHRMQSIVWENADLLARRRALAS